ncbi:MAG: hypothetical protein K8T90_15545 [Planctomycetes bacterium]|nr:hypothetical protein [Planctomycetota bacterium]
MTQTHHVSGMSNREFLALHAAPGRIGLSGGTTWIDRVICRAERHLDPRGKWGVWSHAFLFEGVRADGHHWVIESDLQIQKGHVQFGVQENRVAKYEDEALYGSLAVLDFGLDAGAVETLIRAGLGLVAERERYSLRELVGTLFALQHTELRSRKNLLARDRAVYCSSFVRHLFTQAGLDLAPGVDVKNTTPEDIAGTALPHTAWVLRREVPKSRVGALTKAVRARVRAGAKVARKRRGKPSAGAV